MADFEEVIVTLQSGVDVKVHAWSGSDTAQPLVVVGQNTTPDDWNEFISFLSPSHSAILADVSSTHQLLQLIWEIGEPVMLLAQGELATDVVSGLAATARGAVTSIVISDREIPTDHLKDLQGIPTLILRGRQSTALSHESAVSMHDALRHSTLIEPENCADFPAKDNADAAASAVNWFISGSGSNDTAFDAAEPVDPKA